MDTDETRMKKKIARSLSEICVSSVLILGSNLRAEKSEIRVFLDDAPDIKRTFACVVIAPHARLAARYFPSIRNIIPAVRPVINRVQKQALVIGVRAQIRIIKKRVEHGQSSLPVTPAG